MVALPDLGGGKKKNSHIHYHFGQYRLLYRNLNFWPKSIFWQILGFSISQNMTCHLAGSGRKYDWWPEIVSLDPQNTST